jgi:hypothetical protein
MDFDTLRTAALGLAVSERAKLLALLASSIEKDVGSKGGSSAAKSAAGSVASDGSSPSKRGRKPRFGGLKVSLRMSKEQKAQYKALSDEKKKEYDEAVAMKRAKLDEKKKKKADEKAAKGAAAAGGGGGAATAAVKEEDGKWDGSDSESEDEFEEADDE